jgi:hypothetical protein
MLEAQTEISKRTTSVYHTMDPNESQKMFQHQVCASYYRSLLSRDA